jgi:hypothetical protein
LASVPNPNDLNRLLGLIDPTEEQEPRLMKDTPVAWTSSHRHAAKRHLLQRKDRFDQLQAKPVRRHGVPLGEEGNHVPEIKICPLV